MSDKDEFMAYLHAHKDVHQKLYDDIEACIDKISKQVPHKPPIKLSKDDIESLVHAQHCNRPRVGWNPALDGDD